MKKRLWAIVMTMAMALSLLPVTALADGADTGSQPAGQVQEGPNLRNTGGGGDDPLPGDDVTQKNGQNQEIQSGTTDLTSGTWTISSNVTVTGTLKVPQGEEVIIDLGGHILTLNGIDVFKDESIQIKSNPYSTKAPLINEGTLTIQNGTIQFPCTYFDKKGIVNTGNLTILEDAAIKATGGDYKESDIISNIGGNITTSGTLTSDYNNGITTFGGTVEIAGGSIIAKGNIYNESAAALQIFSQNYTSSGEGAQVTISGGKLESTAYAASTNNQTSGKSNLTITGGTLSSDWSAIYWPSQGTLTIGTKDGVGGPTINTGGSAIEICSGTLNIDSGTLNGNSMGKQGKYETDNALLAGYRKYSGGADAGDAVTIITNRADSYAAAPIQINITGGTFSSKNNYGIRYIDCNQVSGAEQLSQTISVRITGGDFSGDIAAVDAKFVGVDEQKFITGGTFSSDVSEYLADGYVQVDGTVVKKSDVAVAQIGNEYYMTLGEAVAAVPKDNQPTTIKLLKTATGGGVQVKAGQNITFDLSGYTYTVGKPTVGSAGTETNGFQLLKGSTVTFKNGTIKASNYIDLSILFQNYCNLTLENLTLDLTDGTNLVCIISCNYGDTTVKNVNTVGVGSNVIAIDLMHWLNDAYRDKAPTITIYNGAEDRISGKIDVYCYGDGADSCTEKPKLTIYGGTYTANPTIYLAPGYEAFQNGDVYVVGKPVENITLNKSELSMYLNTEETLVATVTPPEAYDKTVTWTSSAPEYVSVENGVVKALKVTAEPVTITAEAGGKTAACQVTVTNAPVGALTLDHTKLSMVEGGAAKLTAEVEPENADQTVTWTTSDEEVAIVSDNGTVTAVKAGAATITAKAGGLTAECQVTVTAKEEDATVIPSVEKPQVDTGDKVPEDVKDVVTEAAESVAADKALSDAAAQQSQQVESKKDELVEQAKQDGLNVSEDQDVNLYTQVYMEIQVEAAKVENGDITSITMDITPVVKVIASTADSSAEIQIGTNAVEVRSEKLELTQASITVQLPDTFESKLVYVKHEASGNNIYYYKAAANGNGVLTFATRDGFSPFTFSVTPFEDVAAWIGSEGYASLEAAVSTVENNGTIVLAKDNSEKIEVRRNITFTIDPADKSFEPKNITAGSRYDMSLKVNEIQGEGGTVTHTYTYDFDRDSSGGSSSSGSYAVSVDAGKHGSVKVSPSRADKGDTVTITVKPDDGYELDELTVIDKDGDSIKLKDKGDGRFTFTMPASKVTVEAVFTALEQEEEQPLFSDVAEDDWYYDAVAYVAENGIMSGTDGSRFSPNGTLTRAMLSQILYAMEDKPAVSGAATFSDVAAGAWYSDAVNWTAAQGIVAGMGENSFAPDAPVTREQLSLILYGYARYKGYDTSASVSLSGYADRDSVAVWAADSMGWAVSEGLISGRPGGYLDPAGTATRAEVAQILMNFCEDLAR